MDLTSLLKQAFDYEHWVDPDLQIHAVKELGLEHIWPVDFASTAAAPNELNRTQVAARAANTRR